MNLDEVMQKMNEINYGWLDIYDEEHINTVIDLPKLYRTSSLEEITQHKLGICFDQVELERYLLSGEYITTSYALIAPHMVHTFLMLEKEGKYIYFEHSSPTNRGIYYFDTKEELLEYTINSFAKSHHIKNVSKIKLVEYPPLAPNTTFDEIKKIVLPSEKEKENKRTF